MIKFLRHIRRHVLADKKYGKYLLYAVGEVFLVVIGILIALQVNNWNEHRQTKNRRISLLENIRSDYYKNELRLKNEHKESSDINSNIRHFMTLVSSEIESTPYDTLKKYASGFINISTFNPLNSSYLTAQSTGDIGLIKDKELLELFIEFQESLDWLKFHVQLAGEKVYLGDVAELRKKLGSLYVILRQDEPDPYPESFMMSEDEFRSFFLEKENYSALESMYWINRNILRSIGNMQDVNDRIIKKINTILNMDS